MLLVTDHGYVLKGKKGEIPIDPKDDFIIKFAMIFEGFCEGLGPTKASKKFGYTRQRYHQLLEKFKNIGSKALINKATGPKRSYRRTGEVERQVVRYRFLDPDISPAVITQKLIQSGFRIRISSVEKVITKFGLQKKTSHIPAYRRKTHCRDTPDETESIA